MRKEYNLENYNFNLPEELIAQKPASPPDTCRFMVLDRKNQKITDDKFLNLTKYLKPGDVLVFNNSKVIPARLIAKKETGGKVEILLLKQINQNSWQCLVGNLKITKQIGTKLKFSQKLNGQIIKREKDIAIVKFNLSGTKLMGQILKIGQMPTPPYIKRIAKQSEYQTFFAKKLGSVAAPTAGLHFTPRIFKKLSAKGGSASGGKSLGVQIEFITLHVGLGTFQPVKTQDITKYQIHEEYFELDKKTAQRLNEAKKEGRKIISVGTTSTRVLESCAVSVALRLSKGDVMVREPHHDTLLKAQNGFTKIYIYPGYKFKFIDALITNFHVPKSSLLLLVSALAGKKFIDKAYQRAIQKKYRFFSFGDVMFIK
ncbi:MAG: tRNA preQ1(34) S-adenosylmethionine ribosyltransferase-isomerase QueA [Patescibacteria group bacterium]|nr:tRNA preQ1(34) S-adenosylmethionine ribosyltransferase-isomerase QueA [Patescibacteria group bacterium]